jgi:predicted aconitase with swiveling domain
MKTFKGRVIIPGNFKGEALVTKQGFNTLATFQKSLLKKGSKSIIGADQNNPDIYGKNITGKVVCLPQTIGSTTGGMILQTAADMGLTPAAFLFSKEIDSLAAAGVILADVWQGKGVITIDNLGDDFLNMVKSGDTIEITEDGTVGIL